MELAIEARSVLRLLLTLLMLYSHVTAGQAPGSDTVKDTLVDDEDLNIGEARTGVTFTVDMTSKIKLNEACHDGKLMENIKTQLRTKLITALGEDCKCQPSESIIDNDKEKVECAGDPIVRYTGVITDWISSKYTVQELAKFIDSWTAVIEIDNGLFKIVFNVTNSYSSIEEFGSGDGLPDGTGGPGVGDEFGSGDIATIEESIPGDEDIANVGGLSGELRVQMVGCIAALCMALAVLLSFA